MNNTAFSPSDKMVELIKDNYKLIQVLSRFGIPMGFGDNTVEDVCKENGVDCSTFICVVNFLLADVENLQNNPEVSLPSLLQFLKQSHIYFLEFCLPAIRKKLLDSITLKDSDVSFLMLKLFDEYVEEIKAHMQEEEMTLFPYVESVVKGKPANNTSIATYSSHHENVGSKLTELKNLIIKYCPPNASINHLNAALYDIYRCEEELQSHCRVEDNILMPALLDFENNVSFK